MSNFESDNGLLGNVHLPFAVRGKPLGQVLGQLEGNTAVVGENARAVQVGWSKEVAVMRRTVG